MQQPDPHAPIDARALSKLKWRCRRGLLENDLFIQRFFQRHESGLTVKQAQGLTALMALSDNDLLDLHLGRKQPKDIQPDLVCDEVFEVLNMLRATPERPQ